MRQTGSAAAGETISLLEIWLEQAPFGLVRFGTLADAAALRRAAPPVLFAHGGGADDRLARASTKAVASSSTGAARYDGGCDRTWWSRCWRRGQQAARGGSRASSGRRRSASAGRMAGVSVGEIERRARLPSARCARFGTRVLETLLDTGLLLVVAPIALQRGTAQLLNVNGDTAAERSRWRCPGSRLVFLTERPGGRHG